MFQLTDRIKEQLIPYAKILIDQELNSISCEVTSKITVVLIKASKAQNAYEQGLVISYPIEIYDEEFLVLQGSIALS